MARKRKFGGRVSVEVEVDPSDILSQMDDAELLQEMEDRNLQESMDGAEELLRCLKRGDVQEAVVLLERILHPKWRSTKLAEAALAQLKSLSAA